MAAAPSKHTGLENPTEKKGDCERSNKYQNTSGFFFVCSFVCLLEMVRATVYSPLGFERETNDVFSNDVCIMKMAYTAVKTTLANQ